MSETRTHAQNQRQAEAQATALVNYLGAMRGQLGGGTFPRPEPRPPWWKRRARALYDRRARIERLERELL